MPTQMKATLLNKLSELAVATLAVPVLDPDQVLKTLHASLARFKHPKAAVVVNELPRNAMGKVQKNLLRAEYGGWFGGGA